MAGALRRSHTEGQQPPNPKEWTFFPQMNYEGSTHPMSRLQEDAKKEAAKNREPHAKMLEIRKKGRNVCNSSYLFFCLLRQRQHWLLDETGKRSDVDAREGRPQDAGAKTSLRRGHARATTFEQTLHRASRGTPLALGQEQHRPSEIR